jgi:hypothetical protein
MKQKLTPWFPADVKPVHVGLYETDCYNTCQKSYQFWNGEYWGLQCFEEDIKPFFPERAKNKSRYQYVCWRGLAEKPN